MFSLSGAHIALPWKILINIQDNAQLPNVDTETGERDKAVPYKPLMKFRAEVDQKGVMKPWLGCNGVPHGQGVVSVGDMVSVTSMKKAIPR